MPPTLGAQFSYISNPQIPLRLSIPDGRASVVLDALIDTGADRSVFDISYLPGIASRFDPVGYTNLRGAGGGVVEAMFVEVAISLLDRDDLTVVLPIAFAEGIRRTVNNLIGLDVLEHFDFALSHADRIGYLGRR